MIEARTQEAIITFPKGKIGGQSMGFTSKKLWRWLMVSVLHLGAK